MNLLKKFSFGAVILALVLSLWVATSYAQPGRGNWYGNNGKKKGWYKKRNGWRNRSRYVYYPRYSYRRVNYPRYSTSRYVYYPRYSTTRYVYNPQYSTRYVYYPRYRTYRVYRYR